MIVEENLRQNHLTGNCPILARAIEIWQPHAQHPLTDEDARQITENTVGFFRILQEWETAERKEKFS